MAVGGLENFDVDKASQDLAAVGRQPHADLYALADQADAAMAGTPYRAPAPTVPAEAPHVPAVAPDLEPPPSATPDIPGQPGGNSPPAPESQPVDDVLSRPPPPPPAMTGDPAKNVQLNMQWQRDLSAYHNARTDELLRRSQNERTKQADSEAAQARQYADRLAALQAVQAADRQRMQGIVGEHVRGRMDAERDLEGSAWVDEHSGVALVATIAGAIAQGLQNAAAAQLGQVGNAQNEAVKTIDRIMQREYTRKKDRLDAMSKSLLEARHGYGDLLTNQRAAQNDLDAEFVAKNRLIVREAEHRLRQAGASDEDIKRNEIVSHAQREAAKLEGQILDREEQRKLQAGHYAAEEAMARTRLDQGERQIEATIADRAANRTERRIDRAERRDERREAREERREDKKAAQDAKDEKGDVRDESGKLIGHVVGGRGGAQAFITRDADFTKAEGQLVALLKDIQDNGERVLKPEAMKRRDSLYANAAAAAAVVSPLGKTNEAIEIERQSIGSSGAGLGALMGANPGAVERKIHELREQRERYRKQTLIPVEGGEAPAAPAKGHAAPAPKTLDRATIDRLKFTAYDDPRAPPARKQQALGVLRANGLAP